MIFVMLAISAFPYALKTPALDVSFGLLSATFADESPIVCANVASRTLMVTQETDLF